MDVNCENLFIDDENNKEKEIIRKYFLQAFIMSNSKLDIPKLPVGSGKLPKATVDAIQPSAAIMLYFAGWQSFLVSFVRDSVKKADFCSKCKPIEEEKSNVKKRKQMSKRRNKKTHEKKKRKKNVKKRNKKKRERSK